MAKIYVSLILKGIKSIDDVPVNLRDEVIALLDESSSADENCNTVDGEDVEVFGVNV